MSNWVYQQAGQDKYYIQYEEVLPEDATDVFYSGDELRRKYGVDTGNLFGLTTEWFAPQSNTVFVKLGEMLNDALAAFKNPKVKFFPASLPPGQSLGYYYTNELREMGLGYTTSKGGGLVPKPIPNRNVPTPQLLYTLQKCLAFNAIRQLERDFGIALDTKIGTKVALNNVVVFAKKAGVKNPPLMMYWNSEQQKYLLFATFEEGIANYIERNHVLYNNPKLIKALCKELKAWWRGAKELQR